MAELPRAIALLCSAGIIIDRKSAIHVSAYIKSLTYIYAPRIGATQRCTVCKTAKQPNGVEIIILPRSALSVLAGCAHFQITATHEPMQSIRGARYSRAKDFLYEDQQLIVAHIKKNWKAQMRANGCASACLDLRAGFGKTFIAAGLIASIGVRALYVVPMRELARQTLADLRAALFPDVSHSELMLRIVYADSPTALLAIANDMSGRGAIVCIAVINSVMIAAKEDRGALIRAFSLSIFDEAHTYCSPMRLEIFWALQTRLMFGMSATIGERRDGFDFALSHHFGPIISAESIEGFSYGENSFKCNVVAVRYYALDEFAQNLRHESTDQVFTHYMFEQFARDRTRGQLIVAQTRELLSKGHNIFIFVAERVHAELVAQDLCEAGVAISSGCASSVHRDDGAHPQPKPVRCVVFYGGVSDEERQIALCGEARIIVATFSYSGTGISIVRMTAMILASPRYSGMKQIVGRILRRGSDISIPRVVVDIIDQKTCLARQFRLRRNAYAFYNASITKIDVRA